MNFIENQAAQKHGMDPRGSALICSYTNYHRLLESSLADLKKKEVKLYNNCQKSLIGVEEFVSDKDLS